MTVTVVIPTIPPRERFLARALRSVDAQTLAPDQVVAELDTTGAGATATRNRALDRATTEWVAFLDDDDELLPHHLEHLVAVQRETGADLVYPWHRIILADGSERETLWPGVQGRPFLADELFGKPGPWADEFDVAPGARNYIPMTVLVRRELLAEVGNFEEWADGEGRRCETGTLEDWLAWRRLVLAGAKIVHTPEVTWLWHHHGRNTSGRGEAWVAAVNAPARVVTPL